MSSQDNKSPSAEEKVMTENLEPDCEVVILDEYNSDLNVILKDGNLVAETKVEMGFCLMWGGARANYGVNRGRVAFEVNITGRSDCPDLPSDEPDPYVARIGWSVDNSELRLGEDKLSFGYGGTGKKSCDLCFTDYGETFGAHDTITAYVDFETKEDVVVISFAKNGYDQGDAFEVARADIGDQALFPHIYIKNVQVKCIFNVLKKSDLKFGYEYIGNLPMSERIRGTLGPSCQSECEVLMMIGLPASGKTYWAEKHSKSHPSKKYNILGTNYIIDQMRVLGLPRKRNYAGRWEILIDRATKCLNELINIACKKNRNYIIDQTNVYASARRRKMLPFLNFKRKAIVVIPTDTEFQRRISLQKREEGKNVPEVAFLEMKANFSLPEVGELFEEIEYTELQYSEAKKLVDRYRMEGEANRPLPQKRIRDDRRFQKFEEDKQYGYGGYGSKRRRFNDSDRAGEHYSYRDDGYNNRKVKNEPYYEHDYRSRNSNYSKDYYYNNYGQPQGYAGGQYDYGRSLNKVDRYDNGRSAYHHNAFGSVDRRSSYNDRYGGARNDYYDCHSSRGYDTTNNGSRYYSCEQKPSDPNRSYFNASSNYMSGNISGVYGTNRSYDAAYSYEYPASRDGSRHGGHNQRYNYNDRY